MEIFDRRPYNSDPYLVIPKKVYQVNVGYENPSLKCFVYAKDNLFGDPMPLELAGLWIFFRIFDEQNILIAGGEAYVSDLVTSEIEYQWDILDIQKAGVYYGEFIFKDIDEKKFILPSREKILIVAS